VTSIISGSIWTLTNQPRPMGYGPCMHVESSKPAWKPVGLFRCRATTSLRTPPLLSRRSELSRAEPDMLLGLAPGRLALAPPPPRAFGGGAVNPSPSLSSSAPPFPSSHLVLLLVLCLRRAAAAAAARGWPAALHSHAGGRRR
jgi:hypothetical protein